MYYTVVCALSWVFFFFFPHLFPDAYSVMSNLWQEESSRSKREDLWNSAGLRWDTGSDCSFSRSLWCYSHSRKVILATVIAVFKSVTRFRTHIWDSWHSYAHCYWFYAYFTIETVCTFVSYSCRSLTFLNTVQHWVSIFNQITLRFFKYVCTSKYSNTLSEVYLKQVCFQGCSSA